MYYYCLLFPGSWGDNELSPECLDGAAGLLKPGGISIPCQYNSYVAPISSPRLWAAAKAASSVSPSTQKDKNLETLWVVYMQNKHDIAETKVKDMTYKKYYKFNLDTAWFELKVACLFFSLFSHLTIQQKAQRIMKVKK